MNGILMVASLSAHFCNSQYQYLYIFIIYCHFEAIGKESNRLICSNKLIFFPIILQSSWLRRKGLGCCSHFGLASWLFCVCNLWDIKETLQEIQLQDSRKNNNKALSCRPPVHVVIVWLEKEKVSHFPHAGKVVIPPHVKDVVLHLPCTLLWDRKWN